MPNFNAQVLDVDSTAKHYIVMSVVDRLMTLMGLDIDDIILNLPYSNAKQSKTTTGTAISENYGQSARVYVDVDDERDPESLNTRGAGFAIAPPIFNNKKYDIRIHPAYTGVDFTLTVRVKTESRAHANTWINKLHRMASQGGDVFVVDATYHYNLPEICLSLLNDLYQSSQAKGTPMDYGMFLREGFVPAVTTSEGVFLVRQTATRIVCRIDGPADVRPEKNDNGTWHGSMNVKFSIQIPDSIDAVYPPLMSNTLVPPRWWQSMLAEGISDEQDAVSDVHVYAQDHVTMLEDIIPIPVYLTPCDMPEHERGTRFPGEYVLVSGYFEMSVEEFADNTMLLNLGDLGEDISFSEITLEYIKKAHEKRPWGEDCVYRTFLYDNYRQCDTMNGAIDQELNYWHRRQFNIDNIYTFGIGVMSDFTYLSEEGKEIIKHFPEVIIDIIVDFRPDIANKYPGIDLPGGGGWLIPDTDPNYPGRNVFHPDIWEEIIDELVDPKRPQGAEYRTGMLTITNNRIITKRSR